MQPGPVPAHRLRYYRGAALRVFTHLLRFFSQPPIQYLEAELIPFIKVDEEMIGIEVVEIEAIAVDA
jgi:hypothetical protein